ncbi:uracil-DNA glycosylase family protein [Streptomyces stramineus]
MPPPPGRDPNSLRLGQHPRTRDAGGGTARGPGGPAGKPFVGPAGKLLDRALEEAGIDPAHAYVTNAVKHFKFEQAARGNAASTSRRACARSAPAGRGWPPNWSWSTPKWSSPSAPRRASPCSARRSG